MAPRAGVDRATRRDRHQGVRGLGRRRELLVHAVRRRWRDQRRGVSGVSADQRVAGVSASASTGTWRARNLNFVLDAQNPDGSWYYAVDGVRDFVDHFHTCFVMKALAKIHALTGHERCLAALAKGCRVLPGAPVRRGRAAQALRQGAAAHGLQAGAVRLRRVHQPVSAAAGSLPAARGDARRPWSTTILRDWVKPDGSFRSRQLLRRMGQRADAPLGAVADVPQPGVLRSPS